MIDIVCEVDLNNVSFEYLHLTGTFIQLFIQLSWFKYETIIFNFYAPTMTMAGALSFTPVRPSVCTYVRTYVCPTTSTLKVEYF